MQNDLIRYVQFVAHSVCLHTVFQGACGWSQRDLVLVCAMQITNRKGELLRQVEVQHQYEKLLKQFEEFLVTAANRLKPEEISAINLPALQQQAEEHKVRN